MHIFVLRVAVYPIVTKLGKHEFYIRMLTDLNDFLIINFDHVTLTVKHDSNL